MRMKWAALNGRRGHEVGRELLAQLYREETGEDCPPILIAPRGKPYFESSNLHFSISHTKKHAFCVLSPQPVGIDAEEKDRKVYLRLADKILSPSERARYEAAHDKSQALLRLWVLKEAAVKLTGEGLQGYPNQTDFSPDDPRIQEIDGCLVAVLKENDHAV
jgi:phosphopantetheinyl transferase